MEANQVRKCVDIATSLNCLDRICVRSTYGAVYSNSQSSVLEFDNSNELVKMIALNANPTRDTIGEGKIHVEFLCYSDISSIFFRADVRNVKDNESTVGTFDADSIAPIYQEAFKEHQATGFSAPRPNGPIFDENGKLIKEVDANGKEIKHYDVPNVPSLF